MIEMIGCSYEIGAWSLLFLIYPFRDLFVPAGKRQKKYIQKGLEFLISLMTAFGATQSI
jgi:hypothetical protein